MNLPKAGALLQPSPAFSPTLLRGLVIHPENPLQFDFIVDAGEERLNGEEAKQQYQRLINYFLASLALPEKDMWVNLSPAEKGRIIPDTLIKTELGRDLLAQDYILKQLTASLIYPEEGLGRVFWQKVYNEAYSKFGVTQVPVNTFNKVWIVPEKASVFEKGNSVYVAGAHLKVMLEEDYLAMRGQTAKSNKAQALASQVLREVIVPAIEKEVNEGKNFARLRQVFYAMVLAQWYQDVFKASILNKAYSGKNKVAGIDLSDPKNKELIYKQYMEAYKKGVFNYIKEETDRGSQQVVPRKYFSGGFEKRRIALSPVDGAMAAQLERELTEVRVRFSPAQSDLSTVEHSWKAEPDDQWYNLDRPLGIFDELKDLFKENRFNAQAALDFLERYSKQVKAQKKYPVQGAWPVLLAVTLLSKKEERMLINLIKSAYKGQPKPPALIDAILLMNRIKLASSGNWRNERTPHLIGRMNYMIAAEVHHWAGGLGPVMMFHGKGMKELGHDVSYIEPWYQLRRDTGNPNGAPLDYADLNVKIIDPNFKEFFIDVGDHKGVKVQVAKAMDENGIITYLIKDVQDDGSVFYARMLYNYGGANNPVTQEQSTTFLNIATAELIKLLEEDRMNRQTDWKPAIVHGNDGQFGPLQAVTMSRYADNPAVKKIFWAFTTHTYSNRGTMDESLGIYYLKHMLGVHDRFINAFRRYDKIDPTSGGGQLANWFGAVSRKHRDDMQALDPKTNLVAVTNGAVPELIARFFRREFTRIFGRNSANADYERPTALQVETTKKSNKNVFNAMEIKSAIGRTVVVNPSRPLTGYVRRLVNEKAGRNRAFTDENIWDAVRQGYDVVLMGADQGKGSVELIEGMEKLERDIAARQTPGRFYFVKSFIPEQKVAFLAALDLEVQDTDEHNGAAERSEEDPLANAALQAGGTYREGVIVEGLKLNFDKPGQGYILMPDEDTAQGWQRLFTKVMGLWKQDPVYHSQFYTNSALGPRASRIENYLISSAAYLNEYEDILARDEAWELADDQAIDEIVGSLGPRDAHDVLIDGRGKVTDSFEFVVLGHDGGNFRADPDNKVKGLRSFRKAKIELENRSGYDAFFHHDEHEDFEHYWTGLLDGLPAQNLLTDRIANIRNGPGSEMEKYLRINRFMERFTDKLEDFVGQARKAQREMADAAQNAAPGGIDMSRRVDINRTGAIASAAVNDQALENILMNAAGVRGIIVNITPITNLSAVLQP